MAGHVDRSVLSSYYQQPGDVYSDSKTEGAFETLAQAIDSNYDANQTHKTAAVLDHPDGSVTNAKLAPGSITFDKFAPGALTNETQNGLRITALQAETVTQLFNVKTGYDAKGDGITDGTAAIQAAIDACFAAGGGVVYFPPGTYLISGSLTLKSNVFLVGVGAKSIIKASASFPANTPLIKNQTTTGTVDTYYDSDMGIRDMVIDGNNNSTRTSEMVSIIKASNIKVERVAFQNATHIGLAFGGCYLVEIMNCIFTNLGRPKPSTISAPALYVDNAGDGSKNKHITVDNCKFINNNWSGMYFMPQGGIVSNCKLINNGESSIFTSSNGKYIRYHNNYIFGADRSNISASGIECGGKNCTMTNNQIYNCKSNGMALTDAQFILIENNIIMNNGQDNVYFTDASGVAIITTATSPNQPDHIQIKHNIIGDDQGTKTQVNGVSVGNSGAAVTNSIVESNDLSGNKTQAFKISTAGKWGSNCYVTGNIGHNSLTPRVGEFQAPAATGSFSVTGLGFRPRYVELHAVEASGTRNVQSFSMIGSNSRVSHYSAADGTTATGSTTGQALTMYFPDGTTKACEAGFVSFDEDGFTLNFTNVTVRPFIAYVAHP